MSVLFDMNGSNSPIEDFALLEAAYAIARIVQAFPGLALPPDEPVEPIGHERQSITLTMAPTDGCRVLLHESIG